MARYRYQLVAVTKEEKEYVIELNNGNKNNKGSLDYIDSGTSKFLNQQKIIDYLYWEHKIPNESLTLKIKYFVNKQTRYLPLIFNNREIEFVSQNVVNKKLEEMTEGEKTKKETYDNFAFAFLKRIETELFTNDDFFYFIVSLNEHYSSEKDSGNYLNDNVIQLLKEYFQRYVKPHNIQANKSHIQRELLNELEGSYKTLRTLYMYHKQYLNYKQNRINNENKKVK